MGNIKEFFKNRYTSLKFSEGGFKKLLVGFIIVNVLFLVNLLLTIFLDYQTEHNYIYSNTAYIVFDLISG